jgi:hypothetical protein
LLGLKASSAGFWTMAQLSPLSWARTAALPHVVAVMVSSP